MATLKSLKKGIAGIRLHKAIAMGAKLKDVITSKGVSSQTIPNLKKK
jgi:hypothetical protein